MLKFKNEDFLNAQINKLDKITKIISGIRLALAINLIVWIICFLSIKDNLLYLILSICSFFVLLLFVLLTNNYFKKLSLLKNKSLVYTMHKKRRELNFTFSYDEGREFNDKNDYKLSDLDIFGSKSLFQYLNITRTKLGRDMLARQLINPEKKDISFTKCIHKLAENEDSLDIEAGLLEFDDSAKHTNYEEFNSLYQKKIEFKPFFMISLLSSYIISIICLVLVFTISLNPYILIPLIIINFLLAKVTLNNDVFKLNSYKYYSLCEAYLELSKRCNSFKINDEYYDSLLNDINKNIDSLKRLKSIYIALSSRKNIIANIIFNSFFIYDFWIILIYNRLINKLDSLEKLFLAIAEIEVMLSFSIIGMDNDYYCIPSVSDDINFIDIYHPLVLNCVENTFNLSGGVVLTGSNMSGKTTFMRTIGLNQILFNAGSIVCAKSFSSNHYKVYTSLRANDMLSEGISTFYAEILRMKKINEALNDGRILILVDEIFKGTNAYERISASLKVIDKLNEFNALFIISTHDFELCDANNILNYHFNEEYNDNKISFDYKIKEGKCSSKNALYLLKMSGII